jgi:hypothetical protein
MDSINEPVAVPMFKVYPSKIVTYASIESGGKTFRRNNKINAIPTLTGSRIHISKRSQRNISNAIDYISLISPTKSKYDERLNKRVNFQITFVTLTLSADQVHTTLELKKHLLNQFFIEVKKKYNVTHYVWRFEQQRNFNAHFHIVLNQYINAFELRELWNRLQNKLGYVDQYRKNMERYHKEGFRLRLDLIDVWTMEAQEKAYQNGLKTHWSSPNSTDIHSVINIKRLSQYLQKYFSKGIEKNRYHILRSSDTLPSPIRASSPSVSSNAIKFLRKQVSIGRLWGCDQELSNAKGISDIITTEIDDELNIIRNSGTVYTHSERYFTVYYLDFDDLKRLGLHKLSCMLLNHIIDTFGVGNNYSP